MKDNAPKRKVFRDAVDLLNGNAGSILNTASITMLPVDDIRPFHNHPFRMYERERLQDMVESVKEYGVLNPVIVRKYNGTYEMLSGHNRQNAAKIARITEIPAIVKEKLSDEEAYIYVIETNLMQRSFTDLAILEKAVVLAERYDKVLSQGKQNDILKELEGLTDVKSTSVHCDQKLWSRDGLASEYGLSSSSVARLLRIKHLIPEFRQKLDAGDLQLMAAVQLSYLPEQGQKMAADARKGAMTTKAITEAFVGVQPEPDTMEIVKEEKPRYKPIKLSSEIIEKYFANTKTKQSQNSKHWWYLHSTESGANGACIIYHKHKFTHPYHQHGRAFNLNKAVKQIQKHDTWQMKHHNAE